MTVPMKYQFTMTASPYEVSIYNDSPFEVSIYNDSPYEVSIYNDSPLKHQFTMADINKNSYRHANLFISLQFSFFSQELLVYGIFLTIHL